MHPEPPPSNSCGQAPCGCGVNRRDAVKLMTLGAAALGLPNFAWARQSGQDRPVPFLIPADKKLSPAWLRSLVTRGTPDPWQGQDLAFIGMPVGGIGCGQLYLAGDGRLWLWDIFKSNYTRESVAGMKLELMTMNGHYTKPVDSHTGIYSTRNGAAVAQGFAIFVKQQKATEMRTLDSSGFSQVAFRGEYPIGRVTYADPRLPVRVALEAFSPFLPLNAKDSALPATVMAFTVTNTGDAEVRIDLMGWLQNATCPYETTPARGQRRNTLLQQNGLATLECSVEASPGQGLETRHGFGSMALSLVGADPASVRGSADVRLPLDDAAISGAFATGATAVRALDGAKLIGSLGQGFTLAPGASQRVEFLLTWYFPRHQQPRDQQGGMNNIRDFAKLRRHYAPWFASAAEAAQAVAARFDHLVGTTRLWNRTWYDSTLPHWLLDRTFLTVDCLATQTLHWFDSGRLWAWEGVECCEGTCTHVWNYAQAMARLFPELERSLREKVDYGLGFHDNGAIANRVEFEMEPATDGQAGTIVRTWREHTMAADGAFLRRVWPQTKQAIRFLIDQDPKRQGLLEGAQGNTLDATWLGPMGWISSLYGAALRAGEQMAREMGDAAFAKTCADLAERGSKAMVERLFNGEYFIHLPPNHEHINTNCGCHLDQVLGQSWACQTGLPRVLPKRETAAALNSLWKYNFAPDAGGYAIAHTAIKGHRVYAAPGEAGLVMTTWPQGGDDLAVPGMANKREDFLTWLGPGGYFDECMTGFEYQVAAHMIYEGAPDSELVMQGLAIARAIHDRYAPAKRNPFNEIECGDHYSRAMAAYGVFLAVCGYEYHGPQGRLGFAPRVSPGNFRAAFTTAEGWGTFSQQAQQGKQQAEIKLHFGKLRLQALALGLVGNPAPTQCMLTLAGKPIAATLTTAAGTAELKFAAVVLAAGEMMRVELT
ncbi:MAG: GH116 family glycosyl-hydrolase [Verrucomicrobia bacterium]|nr:GH116 family glycosyl-hydrolase [Verrucomicrobiota bacterium]